MMRVVLVFILLTTALLSCLACYQGRLSPCDNLPSLKETLEANRASLFCQVIGINSEPLYGADIFLYGAPHGGITRNTTDDNGYFYYVNLDPTVQYKLIVKYPRYISFRKAKLILVPGKVNCFTVIMKEGTFSDFSGTTI